MSRSGWKAALSLALLLIVAAGPAAGAERKLLWQIGKADNDTAEFALGRDGYKEFDRDGFFIVGRSDAKRDWPYTHPGPADPRAGGDEAASARAILDATGVKGGLIVHLGGGDGRLTAALRASGAYLVHGLARDVSEVREARRHIRAEGLYGPVSVMHWKGERLPYADNLVNLLLADEPGGVPMEEMMRVLAPRGVAYVKAGGTWKKTVKPWPVEIDEWTHWLHGPDGNAVAQDTRVGPPRRLQWTARPLWSRHHDTVPSTSAMVSSHGRLFTISDEAPPGLDGRVPDKWFLVARDAFNGALLWKRPMPEWGWHGWNTQWKGRFNIPPQLPKRLVAAGDRVFVTLGFNAPLTALDAATGEVLRVYKRTDGTDEILYHDGRLVLSVNREARRPDEDNKAPVTKTVCVLDADSGRMRWKKGTYAGLRAKYDAAEPFGRLEMAVGDGQVFLADQNSLVSLDLASGRKRWRVTRPETREHLIMYRIRMSDQCVLLYQDGVVLFAQPRMKRKRSWHTLPGTLHAYRAEDGKALWTHEYGGWSHNWQPDVYVIDGLVWLHEHRDVAMKGHVPADMDGVDYAVIGLDLKSGDVKRRVSTRRAFNVGHHHRCHRGKATARFLLPSRRGVEFVDIESGANWLNHWVRGACLFGVVPCNGLLYTPPHPCDCYIETKLNGYFALAPGRDGDPAVPPAEAAPGQVERGPAYGQPNRNLKSEIRNDSDWPTFRHDARRSGATSAPVPAEGLKCVWQTDLGGRASPVTVADGKVFVCEVDAHRVVALDAGTGRENWSFTAGGRVDTPPTIHRGLALFGSADGWVYAVRVSDGELAWQRRVAPGHRLVGAYGQLESAWPVHGSVLVLHPAGARGEGGQDGTAYMVAGRSSYLDGGICAYALDPRTGVVRDRTVFYSPDPETGRQPAGDQRHIPGWHIPGCLADILVTDGSAVYMRQQRVFGEKARVEFHVFATAGMRDGSWFNRTRWAVGAMNHAQLLVFDAAAGNGYGIEAYPNIQRWHFFHPGTQGYLLFSDAIEKKGDEKSEHRWQVRVPVRAKAMVLAGDVLFIAGPPDLFGREDPLGPFEGRNGAVLAAHAVADGKTLAKYNLPGVPVFDGLAAAHGRLFISTRDGRVVCIGDKAK